MPQHWGHLLFQIFFLHRGSKIAEGTPDVQNIAISHYRLHFVCLRVGNIERKIIIGHLDDIIHIERDTNRREMSDVMSREIKIERDVK